MSITASHALPQQTMYRILFAISFVHLLNDTTQSVISSIFPILSESMGLSFKQLGLIAFTLNMTASVIQPVIGFYTDKKPSPFLLPLGMFSMLLGMLGLALASSYYLLLLAVILVGLGSAVFHPEASRVAHMAAGTRRGLGQSIYQVGGNSGQALAPVMTALIFVPLGQFGAIWFTLLAALAILVLLFVSSWYREQLALGNQPRKQKKDANGSTVQIRRKHVFYVMLLIIFLTFARSWYHAGIANFYAFFVMDQYGVNVKEAQLFIFLFLAAGALGTLLGGPLADRFGKKNIIMFSMIGSIPLAILLPFVNKVGAYFLAFLIGFIILSSFSVIVVYSQELIPGRVGLVSGLILGLGFGLGAIGSIVLGSLIDLFGIKNTMLFCSFLPLLGLLTLLLPSDQHEDVSKLTNLVFPHQHPLSKEQDLDDHGDLYQLTR